MSADLAPRIVPLAPVSMDAHTDLANAARFARDHKGGALYCQALGWLIFDGACWKVDDTGAVERLGRETLTWLYREAIEAEDAKLVRWAATSASRGHVEAMLALARSEPGIAASVGIFDRNPYLYNCGSGIIDLKTGNLHPHDQSAHVTRLAPVFYSTEARCPKFLTFLDRIFDGQLDLIEFLQRAVGYSLTGDTSEQVLFVLWGRGANGKTTFIEAIKAVMGDYAMQAAAETFMVSKGGGGPRDDIARLRGARFVPTVETEDGHRFAEALVKQMTGGDTLVARHLYQKSLEFRPQFKLWLATNHKPQIRGTDYAIWRRIRLVPFTVTIPEAERDKALPSRLLAEGPGILRWAVEGCLEWQRLGLAEPELVVAATRNYREEMDVLAGFITECCIVADGLQGIGLFSAYVRWAKDNGLDPVDAREFCRRLEERGHARERSRGQTSYQGIGLRAESGGDQ